MKNYFLLGLLALLLALGCGEDDEIGVPNLCRDTISLDDYIAQNFPDAGDSIVTDPNGLRYLIRDRGADLTPTPDSRVTVAYVGNLTNGRIFDQNPSANFALTGLIEGFRLGLQKIGAGGHVVLFIPADLAYLSLGPRSFQCFTEPLVFDVELKEWTSN